MTDAVKFDAPAEQDFKVRITASHIIDWANTQNKEAQANLPRWIRQLCFNAETTRQLLFPAGDSSFVPGWDGVLSCLHGNAWVPEGPSRWEIGCDRDVTTKANSDYQKRTAQIEVNERLACTFVFVTPRRWIRKSEWVNEQKQTGAWRDVRVIDADDLEQWLEQSPAIALQFGEALGLLERIRGVAENPGFTSPVVVRADSVEEATAFVTAVILAAGSLADQALVVTDNSGWCYVEANPLLTVAVAASPEIAKKPAQRAGLLVIVPHATGNLPATADACILDRPNISEFEKALIKTGMEESDAKRFSVSTGRSWTVLRRQRAVNPAIRNPGWLNAPQSASLAILCLLGTWNANREADKQVVSRLAGRPYEEVERELRQLSGLDDAPLLCIGSVWKAKSPLELLMLFGEHITEGQLERFFAIANEILAAADPQLELPENERWCASVHGKIHPFSGLIVNAICDALIKLAVRGPELPRLQALQIESRVEAFVHSLLGDANAIRWLSLASHLSKLAEAAPNVFLTAIEKSLRHPDKPVISLIAETSGGGLGGRCWHADLLWALETLAWATSRLPRVALLLAKLSHQPIRGNWGNTPARSLFGLFRSWLPQTAAPLQNRIEVLDLLIRNDTDAAFSVLKELASPLGPQFADHASRPKWREDDAGAGNGVPVHEIHAMLAAAKTRLFQMSEGEPYRIAELLNNHLINAAAEKEQVLAQIAPFADASARDKDKEILRVALRKVIHWHRNYSDAETVELESWLAPVKSLYAALAPADLVLRHCWLFNSYWVEVPNRKYDKDFKHRSDLLEKMRGDALDELFQQQGLSGIENLVEASKEPSVIGRLLTHMDWPGIDWAAWIIRRGGDYEPALKVAQCISGLLSSLPLENLLELLQSVLHIGKQQEWGGDKQARLLILARPVWEVWQLAADSGIETSNAYWQCMRPTYWQKEDELAFAVQHLLAVKRPRSALQCCKCLEAKIDPILLFAALQQFIEGEESEEEILDAWYFGRLLEQLEKSSEIDRLALARLEFGLFPVLRHTDGAKATVLYESIMSDPALFVELITLVYKPERQVHTELLTEELGGAANHAWYVLHDCTRMPGIDSDGQIDGCVFTQFIDTVRELCLQADRQAVGDITLGQILAHAPADEDGGWPFAPAREILDRPDAENLREGFRIGVVNKRGVTSRSLWAGGEQERTLAKHYQQYAERVQCSYPNVAALLETIARNYERDGKYEDNEANLRKEGF
jgi:hypothetical protein